MLEFWRNLRKSAAERQQEALNAYLDNALSARERAAFEQQLAADADLRAELEALQRLKQSLSRVPRRRAPRNFTLDPAVYTKPARQPLFQLAPVLPVATALTAIIFVSLVGFQLFGGLSGGASEAASDVAFFETQAAEVEVTRFVTETEVETVVTEGEQVEVEILVEEEAAADEAMDAEAVEEEMEEEEAMEEEELAEEAPVAPEPTPSPQSSPIAESLPGDSGGGVDDATMATVPDGGEDGAVNVEATAPAAAAYPAPPAEAALVEQEAYEVPETAVSEPRTAAYPEEDVAITADFEETATPSFSLPPLLLWQLVAGILFVLLLSLTLYVRRQR